MNVPPSGTSCGGHLVCKDLFGTQELLCCLKDFGLIDFLSHGTLDGEVQTLGLCGHDK